VAVLAFAPCAAYGQAYQSETASQSNRIPAKGATSVYGFMGYGTQALGDVNAAIEDDEAAFQGAGIPVNFETFGGAIDFSGGVVHQVGNSIGLGVELGYQGNSIDNRYTDVSGSYSDAVDLRIVDVTGVLQFWVPAAPGLLFGTNVGAGFGSAKDEFHLVDYNNSANDTDYVGEWSGVGLSAGAFAGYHFALGKSAQLLLHSGYRYRNLGEFSGEANSPQWGSSTAPPSDNAGQPLDFDFSGFYTRLGFGFSFGG
jgi:hypothetical protein